MVISEQDAECKSLAVAYKSSLKIQGRTLDLGSSTADTTSTLQGRKWVQISDDATTFYWVDLPFDITMTGGTLDIDHDFDHEGKLTVWGNAPTTKIKVDGAAVDTFNEQ